MIGRVERWMNIKLDFSEPSGVEQQVTDTKNAELASLRKRGPQRGTIQGKFYLMDSLADPLILGFPELSALGCWMEPPDDSGRR